MTSKETVSANITLDSEAHRKLRILANKTGLTNSEIINELILADDMEVALKILQPAIKIKKDKKANKQKALKEVEALSPERVRELLALLKR